MGVPFDDSTSLATTDPWPRALPQGAAPAPAGTASDGALDWVFREPLAGRYEVVAPLGQGGMGFVFKALDLREERRPVAIKLIMANEPRELVRLKREYRRMEGIAHPALVSLFGLEVHDKHPFIVMEYIDGVDFYRGVRAQPDRLDLEQLRTLLRPLARGLTEMHAAGRVHRDLKGSNVMVTAEGRVVILDFGLVNDLRRRTLYTSTLGTVEGTPAYMSPEQAAGQLSTPASDWYALGVMLFHLITGRYPLEGHIYAVLTAKLTQDPPRVAVLVPNVPADLDELIARLLQRDPGRRASGIDVLTWCERGLSPAPQPRPSLPPLLASAALIERERQLEALEALRRRWLQRLPLRVDLSGPAGTGKTALLRHFLATLRRSVPDVVILEGACHEFDAVPLKAFDGIVDALARFLRKQPSDWLVSLLSDCPRALERLFPVLTGLRGSLQAEDLKRRMGLIAVDPDPAEQRQQAVRGLRHLLYRIAIERRLVLAVDDLHWGDLDSARLLLDLLAEPGAPPLLFLCTYPEDHAHHAPILRELDALQPAGLPSHEASVIRVGALSDTGAAALALRMLDGKTDRDRLRARAIAAEARNNPMLIEASIIYLGNVEGADMSRITLARQHLSIEQLVTQRLQTLDPGASALLEVVAAAGQPLEHEIAELAAAPAGDLRAALAQLRSSHLLRTLRGGAGETIEVYHSRIRQAALGRLDPPSFRDRHRRVAEALVAAGRDDPRRLAFHWYSAGEREHAHEAAIEAADVARAIGSHDSACVMLRLALSCRPNETTVMLRLAETLKAAGRLAEAAPLFLAAADLIRQPRSARAARRNAGELWLSIGEVAQGIAALRPLLRDFDLEYPEQDSAAVAAFKSFIQRLVRRGTLFTEQSPMQISGNDLERLDLCMSLCRGHMAHDPIRGGLFAAQSAIMALDLGEVRRIVPTLALAGVAAHERDQAAAQCWIDEAERIADAIHDREAQAFVQLCIGVKLRASGAWGPALAELELGLRQLPAGSMWERSLASASLLACLEALGELAALERRAKQIARMARDFEDRRMLGFALLYSAIPALAADDIPRCERHLNAALAAVGEGEYQVAHLYALKVAVDRDLYISEPRRAWQRVAQEWDKIDRSSVMQAGVRRFVAFSLRARAGLALWASGVHEHEGILRVVEQDVVQLHRESSVHAVAFIALLQAGIAGCRRERAGVLEHLEVAISGFDQAGMAIHATCARRSQAQWSNPVGPAFERAETFLRLQGVACPDRWTNVVAPGLMLPPR